MNFPVYVTLKRNYGHEAKIETCCTQWKSHCRHNFESGMSEWFPVCCCTGCILIRVRSHNYRKKGVYFKII
jgi:hypothetical protein